MTINERAGRPADPASLVDVDQLVGEPAKPDYLPTVVHGALKHLDAREESSSRH